MNATKCGCGNSIPVERIELGYKICVECGERVAQQNKRVGFISYGHKTAGAIVLTSKKGLDNYKKVSYRRNKGSNMGYASRLTTSF